MTNLVIPPGKKATKPGNALVEYALIGALVAGASITGLSMLGLSVNHAFSGMLQAPAQKQTNVAQGTTPAVQKANNADLPVPAMNGTNLTPEPGGIAAGSALGPVQTAGTNGSVIKSKSSAAAVAKGANQSQKQGAAYHC